MQQRERGSTDASEGEGKYGCSRGRRGSTDTVERERRGSPDAAEGEGKYECSRKKIWGAIPNDLVSYCIYVLLKILTFFTILLPF